jgi:hypothetical protein
MRVIFYGLILGFKVGGNVLKTAMVGGACLKALGVLNTYLCTCSEMLAAWGEETLLGTYSLSQ